MGGKPRKTQEYRLVILLVRPSNPGHPWWAKDDSGEYRLAAIDPYDPPSWSLCIDSDCEFDSVELWEQLRATIEEHVEALKEEWMDEYGPDGEGEGCEWEFKIQEVRTDAKA